MEKILLLSALLGLLASTTAYAPNWESLDNRPLPQWYDEAKLGIFIHWGVFSVPSYSSEWFWWSWKGQHIPALQFFMDENYRPDFTYADFAPMFTTEFFSPAQWAALFNASGAEYVVLTSKHHEGFTNWPSKHSFNWNSMEVGPKRDLVGELADAIRQNTNIHFGLYHSLFEWFHPLYLKDKAAKFKTQDFVASKTLPELYEIVNAYKPEVIWSDGDWEANSTYWNSTEFLAWLYTDSPVKDTVVTNDRWGKDATCKHGGYFTCQDRFNPGVVQKRKFENAMTIDKYSWGYRRDARLSDYLTIEELLKTFVETVSCGGNMLMNIGPTKEGTIAPIFQERLLQMGSWMTVNGEGIRATHPWKHQNDTLTKGVWYTEKRDSTGGLNVYAINLNWPTGMTLSLGVPMPTTSTEVTLLGYPVPFKWQKRSTGGIDILIPKIGFNEMPCKWAWTFKLTNLMN
ncbi:alpha-L-fucosidase [Patella vulgata]|uniref:alpha-L-fucosidase n=1 Tax=Patella vulgata TaxID=6465 RepID=UPI00217F2342|nr:alpha-L-fucosidase [Patella vulgata]